MRGDEDVAEDNGELDDALALSRLLRAIGEDLLCWLADRELRRTGGWLDFIGVLDLVGVSCWCLEWREDEDTEEGELEEEELWSKIIKI